MSKQIEKYSIVYYIRNRRVIFYFSASYSSDIGSNFEITKTKLDESFCEVIFVKSLQKCIGISTNSVYGLMERLDQFILQEFKHKTSAMAFNHNA